MPAKFMTEMPAATPRVDAVAMSDDTRTLQPGDVFVWDQRIKPGIHERLFAEARAKGAAAIISNVVADGVIYDPLPGAVLAHWACERWPLQPARMLGVTGTSGKTSVAWFGQQLARRTGCNAASIGTLGIVRNDVVEEYTGYTSPTALQVHPLLDRLAREGVDTALMEVSSHALELRRSEGVRWAAAGLTNMTQDHLDFHGTLEEYHAAKARFFSEVLPEDGVAVVNIGRMESWPVASIAKQRGIRVLTVGTSNAELVVAVEDAGARGLSLSLKYEAVPVPVRVPLIGTFQAENLAVALGLLVGTGSGWKDLAAAVEGLKGVPGRMEMVPGREDQPVVVVDYAHKPDALQRALESLAPAVDRQAGGRLRVVFGCGGNRDAGKRPIMGEIAARLADDVIVTDDNPRHETAADIRAQVMAGVRDAGGQALEIGDRREAIAAAIGAAGVHDVVLVAGKGHEDGQIVGDEVLPFDDRMVVREILG